MSNIAHDLTALRDKLLAQLRAQGERITIQRRRVIEALCAKNGHQTIGEIRAAIQRMGDDLDESTIYRILQRLNELGMVSQTDLGTQGIVYEVIQEKPHHHLVCLSCGLVIHVDDSFTAQMREQIRRDYHFEPRVDHMAIFGLCEACQQRMHSSPSLRSGERE